MDKNHIFQFVIETTKENFETSQQSIFSHESYDPYSEDLENIENLLDENRFEEVIKYNNINILLSPRAHLYKSFALRQLGEESNAKSEVILAHKILEGISLTGEGTQEKPFVVTRISDEKDFLTYLEEQFSGQSLQHSEDKIYDVINTVSQKEIYFDITVPYQKMMNLINNQVEKPTNTKTKKWWQFWK